MKIFYLYGRSCSGKDTIIQRLIFRGSICVVTASYPKDSDISPRFIPTYTSREIRESDDICITIHKDIDISGTGEDRFVDTQYIDSIKRNDELTNISIFAISNDTLDHISTYSKLTAEETVPILKEHDNFLIVGDLPQYRGERQTKCFILLSKYNKFENGKIKEVYYARYFTNKNDVFLVGDTKMLRLLEEYDKDMLYTISLLCEDKVLLKRALDRDGDVDEIIRRYLDDKKVFNYTSKVDGTHRIGLFTDVMNPKSCVDVIDGFIALVNNPEKY